jgi:hypothetical protein
MVRNAAKANWRIDELGLELHAPGNYSDWDGLFNMSKHMELRGRKLM